MTNEQQGVLNPLGVNCLRDFQGVGTIVFGAWDAGHGEPVAFA